MNKNTKIIVTQTSWKKRIDILAQSITQFLVTQTIRPDEYHVWLSVDEFPNKEKDLPTQLVIVMKLANIKLHWLEGNEYCCKRWHIYPDYYDDYVVSIDDDCIYDNNFIKDALTSLSNSVNTVYCPWRQFHAIPTYDNDIKIHFKYYKDLTDMKFWWCAQCMIPPHVFPMQALDDSVIQIRNEYALKNDEAWLIPFFLKNYTKMTSSTVLTNFQTFSTTNTSALGIENGQLRDKNGYSATDKSLFNMLKYTNNIEMYKQFFPKYSYESYLKLAIAKDSCISSANKV